ncbi:MAG: GGDEF domain-containing protein, partial [Miltoncostaeaceae bacterium]
MSASTDHPESPGVAGARGRRDWYGLEARHSGLFVLRAGLFAGIGVVAALPTAGLDADARWWVAAICAAVVALHGLLRAVAERAPRLLRAGVDLALALDAGALIALASLDGHLASRALWMIPVLTLAATLGLSSLTGLKSLLLFAIATGVIWLLGPVGVPLTDGLLPLGIAAAVVATAAVMVRVNERELVRRGERLDVLHDAGMAFVATREPEALAALAQDAAGRLMPGWAVVVALGDPTQEQRTWRAGGLVHLALPITSPTPESPDAGPEHHGVLRASRPEPRGGRAMNLRAQQLRALQTLCAGLAAALTQSVLVDRLERLSLIDPLTGLANRRAFDDALEVELARCRRTGEPMGLVLLDVDHFKRFTDSHGHPAGDRALAAVAARLTATARREDRPCRVGGEEFAVLLPGADHAATAEVAER